MLLKNAMQKIMNSICCRSAYRLIWPIVFLCCLTISTTINAQQGPQPRLPTIELSLHMYVIQAEVARTDQQQSQGLMHRQLMGDHEGMLFVYDRLEIRCFWMRNTLIPLTIAFIGDDGTIVNMRDMKPETEKPPLLKSTGPFCVRNESRMVQKKRNETGF